MEKSSHCRQQAKQAWRPADMLHQPDASKLLRQFAKEYEERLPPASPSLAQWSGW
ncbi:MAG TPA: hypothetical protein VN688_03610 [Gemmataceae bacterium]|nr:hypothetical protein [Gemmataceae bacterium]